MLMLGFLIPKAQRFFSNSMVFFHSTSQLQNLLFIVAETTTKIYQNVNI